MAVFKLDGTIVPKLPIKESDIINHYWMPYNEFETLEEVFCQRNTEGRLNKAKKQFNDIEYFTFDVTNKEISNFFNVQYQSTILIFKNNQEVYRSIRELSKDEIYKAINAVI